MKLEVKVFKDKANVLYIAIALEIVKATEVSKQGNTKNGVTQNSRSVADISIAQLFEKINPRKVRGAQNMQAQPFMDDVKAPE